MPPWIVSTGATPLTVTSVCSGRAIEIWRCFDAPELKAADSSAEALARALNDELLSKVVCVPEQVPVAAVQATEHDLIVRRRALVEAPSVISVWVPEVATERVRFLPSSEPLLFKVMWRFTTSPGTMLEIDWLKPNPLSAKVRLTFPAFTLSGFRF